TPGRGDAGKEREQGGEWERGRWGEAERETRGADTSMRIERYVGTGITSAVSSMRIAFAIAPFAVRPPRASISGPSATAVKLSWSEQAAHIRCVRGSNPCTATTNRWQKPHRIRLGLA